jgi:hypothetical protein
MIGTVQLASERNLGSNFATVEEEETAGFQNKVEFLNSIKEREENNDSIMRSARDSKRKPNNTS